jgi:hypothetical protein
MLNRSAIVVKAGRKTSVSMPSAIGLISNTMPNLIDWLRVSCSPKNDAIYFWRTTTAQVGVDSGCAASLPSY